MGARRLLGPKEAFDAYESVRRRLPEATFPNRSRRADSLADVAEDFDAFLLDAFGVLNVGETPIPGAPERMAQLRRAGKRLLVLTNGATHRAEDALRKYHRLGFDFAPDEVISSRDALETALSGRSEGLWGVMAPPGAHAETLGVRHEVLGDESGLYDRADGFILLGSGGWSSFRQARLVEALKARPRPLLVGNPDIVAPREHGLSEEPGLFAHLAADATEVKPVFYGKPFPDVYRIAMERLGLTEAPGRERVLMVGDTLHTDILGGAAAGVKTALISSHGVFREGGLEDAIDASGIRPDWILRTT